MKKRDLYAFAGKTMRVDLGTGRFSDEPTAQYAREWLGGSGTAQWILYNELKPWITPFEPANRLIFSVGPLTGTLAPGGSRMSADSKNPLTMGVGSSNADSFFGQELKFAGFDHIIFQGKSNKPVYLWIDDDHVELKDASQIWGMTTWETADAIRSELGDGEICIISIGPAGENLVREACIVEGKGRAMGRCGLGAVMGSKNLKAVAVRGTGSVEVAEPEKFMEIVLKLREMFKGSNSSQRFEKYGTPGAIVPKQQTCGYSL